MTKARREFSSGGIVIRPHRAGRRVLLIKDPYGRWTWPKGKIEKGESPLEAAKREIAEETGLREIEKITKIGQSDYFYRRNGLIYKTVHLFLFRRPRGKREKLHIQRDEIEDGRWFPEKEALSVIGYERGKEFLRKALRLYKKRTKPEDPDTITPGRIKRRSR